MRIVRGRAATLDADSAATDAMVERADGTGEPALRAWTPHRQVAFGRRDTRADGYERARRLARRQGYPPVERRVGGRAVVFTGSTVSFAHADPTAGGRTAIQSQYEDAVARLREALAAVGVDARPGEPDRSFCPGTHSLQAGGKIAGLGQRVRQGVTLVGGIVVVRDADRIGRVLAPVYDALEVPFDPDSVGSVAAGGDADPTAVARAIEDAFADGPVSVSTVGTNS
jgi:lipoate-protein ligase A